MKPSAVPRGDDRRRVLIAGRTPSVTQDCPKRERTCSGDRPSDQTESPRKATDRPTQVRAASVKGRGTAVLQFLRHCRRPRQLGWIGDEVDLAAMRPATMGSECSASVFSPSQSGLREVRSSLEIIRADRIAPPLSLIPPLEVIVPRRSRSPSRQMPIGGAPQTSRARSMLRLVGGVERPVPRPRSSCSPARRCRRRWRPGGGSRPGVLARRSPARPARTPRRSGRLHEGRACSGRSRPARSPRSSPRRLASRHGDLLHRPRQLSTALPFSIVRIRGRGDSTRKTIEAAIPAQPSAIPPRTPMTSATAAAASAPIG